MFFAFKPVSPTLINLYAHFHSLNLNLIDTWILYLKFYIYALNKLLSNHKINIFFSITHLFWIYVLLNSIYLSAMNKLLRGVIKYRQTIKDDLVKQFKEIADNPKVKFVKNR